MLLVNIFVIVLLIHSVVAINDTIPETPSHFVPHTKSLPERGDSIITNLPFQNYIPVACFCDRPQCNAKAPPVESPVIGLLKRDGEIVQSLDIKANKGELMYIILISSRSSLVDDTYLERTSYWRLTDGQHQVLSGVPLDLDIRRQVSVSVIRENSLPFVFEAETKKIAISALEMSTSLQTLSTEESESKSTYHYSASQSSQIVGVYQLFHELAVHPGVSLTNYAASQKTGAQCSKLIFFTEKCGFLQLLPSFLQRTSNFRQVSVSLADQSSKDTEDLQAITGNNEGRNKKGLSKKALVIIISASIGGILLVTLIIAILYYNSHRKISSGHYHLPSEDPDDNQELIVMPEKKTEQVLPII